MRRFLTREELIHQIKIKKTCLCIGLDTDINKLPSHFQKTPESVVEFNESIIEETHDLCVSYKLNTAFYEAMGSAGWECLKRTIELIPENSFVIADAKRGDIGNTAEQYVQAFFEDLDVNAITLSPYMGKDSVTPYLNYKGKWIILLGLTSNEGANDFQMQPLTNGRLLYEEVIETSALWGSPGNTMYVVGATKTAAMKRIRRIIPDHFLLVPGIGAQAGNITSVLSNALSPDVGLLINASRSILYAGAGKDFAIKARTEALRLKKMVENSF